MKTIHFRNIIRRKILHNKFVAHFLSRHCLKTYLALYYKEWTGRRANYNQPEDLNQALIKLSWQNSHNPKMREFIPICVDKYAVREYISSKGYGDTLNELIGVYDNVEEIDLESLPNQFVMKMNNASGRNWICTNKAQAKAEWSKMKAQFAEWLRDTDFGWQTGEWQYRCIKPRIVAEKYLEDMGGGSLIDYKAQVFNGKVVDFFVCYNRDNEIHKDGKAGTVCYDCYDAQWNRTEDISMEWHKDRQIIPAPKSLKRMIRMAEDCCKGIPYCRFDMYEIDGKIVFGEMTFTPHGNVMDYYTDEYLKRTKDLLK